MNGLPEIDVEIRLTYPTSNEVERPGAHLTIQDEASGLPLLRVYLSDADLLDLLASRGVHVTGTRTPLTEHIGEQRRHGRVLVAGYLANTEKLEALYVEAETDARNYGWHSTHRTRDKGGDWLTVAYWGAGGPSDEMLDEQRSRAFDRLAEATGGK